tara:strand:+ start:2137 stop:2340 length:204 start_codon:yes stop_codon:yes gene_type:complete
MVITLTIVALVFTFYVPFYLKRREGEIKPTINIFEKFLNNDQGYPWSTEQDRKDSYQEALEKKINAD